MRFSHMFRYSCQHSHLRALHSGFPCCFDEHTTLPYSKAITRRCHSFGATLEPRYIIRAAAFDQ